MQCPKNKGERRLLRSAKLRHAMRRNIAAFVPLNIFPFSPSFPSSIVFLLTDGLIGVHFTHSVPSSCLLVPRIHRWGRKHSFCCCLETAAARV